MADLRRAAALQAATLPGTPTDRPDERHDVPAVRRDRIAGCKDWLNQMKFLRPATKDDMVWEKIKRNWIGFLAATGRIPYKKVAALAPNRKIVQWGSVEGGETEKEGKKRFQDDHRRRMTIQASFWNHLDSLERHTEKWPQEARLALNSMDKEYADKPFETLAPIWELNKRRRTQAIWYSLVAFLLHSHDEGTLKEMGLILNEEQVDDLMDIEQEVWNVDPGELATQPEVLSEVWGRTQALLTGSILKTRSTARNNPLLWWICILARSAVSGETDFISSGRFNRNPLPMDVDMAGRVQAILHYAKVFVLEASFWSWDDEATRFAVGLDIDPVDIGWLHVEGGSRPDVADDGTRDKVAWRAMLDRLRTNARKFLGGESGTVLHGARLLEEALKERSERGALRVAIDNTDHNPARGLIAREFARTNELLMMLGDQIHDRKTIWSLCQVNRRFHGVFVSKMYRRLTWTRSNDEKLRVGDSNGLQKTKEITLGQNDGLFTDFTDFSKEWEVRVRAWDVLNAKLAALVRRTTFVTVFVNHSLPLAGKSLESLRLSPELQDLTLSVSSPALQHLDGTWARVPDILPEIETLRQFLPRFENIRALRLYKIAIDLSQWSGSVTGMLQLNPQLELLCLSICEQTALILGMGEESSWLFRDICSAYAEGGHRPLKLRTLELGGSLNFPEPEALSALTDLSHLESVFVDNDIYHSESVVPWNILSPKVTPHLRQIRLKCLDEDVCDGIERLDEEGRVVEVFQAFQFSYETLEGETACLSRLLSANQLLQAQCVLLPAIDAASYDDDVVETLQGCHRITHLTLPLDQDPEAVEGSIEEVHTRMRSTCNLFPLG